MKTIAIVCLITGILILSVSCKKTIDQQKEVYVLGVLTEGSWRLENYTENDADNTYDFIEYEFQFYDNNKVDAITTSSVVAGTWSGDASNLTFTINFPASSTTLARLNHPWQWIKSNIGLIFAEFTDTSKKISIRLRKK